MKEMDLKRLLKEHRKAAFVLAGMALLSACAQAPEQSAVGQKNAAKLAEALTDDSGEGRSFLSDRGAESEETEEAAPSSAVNQTPEAFLKETTHYTFNYVNDQDGVNLQADGPVLIPTAAALPSYSLECTGFTQEQATSIYNFLFQGKKTYRTEGTDFTKDRVETALLEAREELAQIENREGEYADDDEAYLEEVKNWQQQYIEHLENYYEEAPEESTLHKVEVDSTFHDEEMMDSESDEPGTAQELWCETDDGDSLDIFNVGVTSGGWPSLFYNRDREGLMNYSLGHGDLAATLEEAQEKLPAALGLDVYQAKQLADDFLKAAGVETRLVAIALQTGYSEVMPEAEGGADDENWQIIRQDAPSAVEFRYGRIQEGIPAAVTFSSYVSDDDAALIWGYERIAILVDREGIKSIQWEFPDTVTGQLTDDTAILPFEKAREIFEDQAPLLYEGRLTDFNATVTTTSDMMVYDPHEDEKADQTRMTLKISVDRVELNLMRVRGSGRERTGYFVPAWVFYGTETRHFHNDQAEDDPEKFPEGTDWEFSEDAPWIIFAVNAVDGTVIDVVEGY